MSEFNTVKIQDMVAHGGHVALGEAREVMFAERPLHVVNEVILLSAEHRREVEHLAGLSLAAFGIEEPTMVAREHGIPTMCARADFAVTEDGIGLFEVDERPAGIGITDNIVKRADGRGIMPRLTHHFERIAGEMPVVVRHPEAKPNDDGMVLDVCELEDGIPGRPVLARGEPAGFAVHPHTRGIQERSVSTVLSEGDKHYLLAVPEAKATIAEVSRLDRDKSTVIKPLQGSKAQGVKVYLSSNDRRIHGDHGTVTFGRLEREVAAAQVGSLLMQEFLRPTVTKMPDGDIGNMVLRVFLNVHPGGTCEVIGGTYVVRRELVVHGASNSFAGALLVE